MSTISASMVKELREITGAGMMECKKALTETAGDIQAAVDYLRTKGMASADKKSSRITAEGLVNTVMTDDAKHGVIIEVNCETDFVAKDENFIEFVNTISELILAEKPADLEAAGKLKINDKTVEETRQALINKIGENVTIRRFEIISTDQKVAQYSHGSRIGVMVEYSGDDQVGKDVAMHIAACTPVVVSSSEMPQALVESEKAIFIAQAQESGKPADIIEKMIEGRIKKFLGENSLLGQPFVKNPDVTVEQHLKENNAGVVRMIRFEAGEGIEKKQDNFAEEVMAQVKGK